MVKRILLTIVQFILFLVLLDVGGNWDVIRLGQEIRAMQTNGTFFNPIPTIKYPISSAHLLIANGLLFSGILLLLIVLFLAIRKRLKPWVYLSVLAWVLAVFLAFSMKMGLPPAF